MSAFEFFFSFYGLLLGLSVAAIATGLALAIQNRMTMRIGYLTPLLATFVGLDIASFWDFAWTVLRDAPFSYGLLVMGLIVALVYFVAASLVFPYAATEGQSLDDHFWSNKRTVLLLTTVANTLSLCLALPFVLASPDGAVLAFGYGFNLLLYVLLILPAALAKKPRLFVILTALHIGLYLAIAVTSVLAPSLMTMPEGTPPAAAG
ncbi:hypothetical protein [Brevundimonas subvibrioides]|uniref:hypothetical protein n=1 Tax=Brevundimonas subvibrioides TaxID=74313 RepID=UPI0022B358F2|nr:hypothetical protein [Brevundimonas subvibrioides]